MIDLVILAGLAFLIARIIWNILNVLENLFSSRKPVQQAATIEPPAIQKKQVKLNASPQKKSASRSTIYNKSQIQQVKVSSSIPEKLVREVDDQDINLKINAESVLERKKSQQQVIKKEKAEIKATKDKEALRQKEQVFPVWLEKQEIKEEEKADYPAIISKLQEEIESYKRQKQFYVQRIQEIIQHVVNENEGQLEEESRNSTEDEQLHAINNLKHQLNTANAKINQQKEQLNLKFQKQQLELKRYYQELQKSSEKNFNNKMQEYQSTITEVTSRIHLLEQQRIPHIQSINGSQNFQQKEYQLQLRLNDQAIQLRESNKKIEQLSRSVEKLQQSNYVLKDNIAEKQAKIQKSKYECEVLLESTEKLSKQNQKLKKQLESQAKNSLNIQNKSSIQKKQQQASGKQLQQLLKEKEQIASQLQTTKIQLRAIKEQLGKAQNNEIQLKTRFEAQASSLEYQNGETNKLLQGQRQKYFKLEQQLEQAKYNYQQQKAQGQHALTQSVKHSEELSNLQANLRGKASLLEESQRKLAQTQEQLKFCQEQIKNAKETQAELREKLVQAISSPNKSERSYVKKEDVFKHPEYLSLKRKLQQLEGKRMSPSSPEPLERVSAIIPDSINGAKQREVSPSFPQINMLPNINKRDQTSPISEDRNMYKTAGLYQLPKPSNNFVSTIYSSGRSNTPADRPVAFSSIMEGGILGEVYLGETQLLNEDQRNFLMHEISVMKRITAKKTRLMFSSRQNINKPITEYLLGAPNLIVIAQLENKKLVGAFTQNAFSKETKLIKTSILSKAMIFDITNQAFITNEGQGEITHYEEGNLIWGKNQFVISCSESITISVDLNCEGAIYPSTYTSKEFLKSQQKTLNVTRFEAHRVFLG